MADSKLAATIIARDPVDTNDIFIPNTFDTTLVLKGKQKVRKR